MFALNSFNLIFSIFVAGIISSSSLAQTVPNVPTINKPIPNTPNQTIPNAPAKNQITPDQETNNKPKFSTVIIETPNNQAFRIEDTSKDQSWIVNIFSTLLGAVTGGVVSYIGTLKVAKQQLTSQQELADQQSTKEKEIRDVEKYRQSLVNTFEMMKEWDSESMSIARRKTFEKYIINQNNIKFSDLDLNDKIVAFKIIEFFDRLDFLYNKELIDKDAATQYFSSDYQYWKSNYFDKQGENLKEDLLYKDTFKKTYKWLQKS